MGTGRPKEKQEDDKRILSELLQIAPMPNQKQPIEELGGYYKLELEQVIQRITSLETTRAQLITLLGTAHLAILGAAFTVKKAGLIFMASAALIILTLVYARVRRRLIAYYYRGLQLQKRYAPYDEETFLSILPTRSASIARKIAQLPNVAQRKAALLKSSQFTLLSTTAWGPLVIIAIEAGIALTLWYVFNWPLF